MNDMDLPGAEIVAIGLEDAQAGRLSSEVLALRVFGQRLRALGIEVDATDTSEAELALYEHLRRDDRGDAYGRYNALLRRLDSFSAALEQRQRRARGV